MDLLRVVCLRGWYSSQSLRLRLVVTWDPISIYAYICGKINNLVSNYSVYANRFLGHTLNHIKQILLFFYTFRLCL